VKNRSWIPLGVSSTVTKINLNRTQRQRLTRPWRMQTNRRFKLDFRRRRQLLRLTVSGPLLRSIPDNGKVKFKVKVKLHLPPQAGTVRPQPLLFRTTSLDLWRVLRATSTINVQRRLHVAQREDAAVPEGEPRSFFGSVASFVDSDIRCAETGTVSLDAIPSVLPTLKLVPLCQLVSIKRLGFAFSREEQKRAHNVSSSVFPQHLVSESRASEFLDLERRCFIN